MGFAQTEWFRAFFESNLRAGAAGAMFWILTPDPNRGFGITYTTPRDQAVFAEIERASRALRRCGRPIRRNDLTDAGRHLIPRQFAWARAADDVDYCAANDRA